MNPPPPSENPGPQLFPELLHAVLDNLRDDKHTLSACTLVSRSCWFTLARQILFRRLEVNGKSRNASSADIAEFLRTTPNVAKHIRELRIEDIKLISRRGQTCPPLRRDTLTSIIASLPTLESLEFDNVMWECRPEEHTCPQRWPGSSLRNLSVVRLVCLSDAVAGLSSFLKTFETHSLFTLRVHSLWNIDELALLHTGSKDTIIGTERLCADGILLRPLVVDRYLKHLEVICHKPSDLDMLQVVLSGPDVRLQSLYLDLSTLRGLMLNLSSFDISQCTSLENIHFLIFMSSRYKTPGDSITWQHTIDILSRSPPSIRHISFGVEMFSVKRVIETSKFVEWDRLEELMLDRFRSLESVTICREIPGRRIGAVRQERIDHSLEKFFEEKLPGLKERGLLNWESSAH